MDHDPIRLPDTALVHAFARLAAAGVLFGLSMTDYRDLGFQSEPDDFITLAYLAFAGAMALTAWTSWRWTFGCSGLAIVVDFLALVAVPRTLPNLWAGSTSMIGFLTVTAVAVRFGRKAGGRAAVAAAILAIVGAAFPGAVHLDPGGSNHSLVTSVWHDMRLLVFVLVTIAGAAWLTRWLSLVPQIRWPANIAATNPAECGGEALISLLRATRAERGVLCWMDLRGQHCVAVNASTASGRWEAVDKACSIGDIGRDFRSGLFDLAGEVVLVAGPRGLRFDSGLARTDAFLKLTGQGEGLTILFHGMTGSGRLVLTGFPRLTLDHLRLSGPFASWLVAQFDRIELDRVGRKADAARLRGSIARDLHDTVAQSLAAASYWLRGIALHRDLPPSLRENLEETIQSLEAEGREIRGVIDTLRRDPDDGPRDLIEDLRTELRQQETQWRFASKLEAPEQPLRAAWPVVHDVRQMLREAVANAVRHGSARNIEVTLAPADGSVEMRIVDDGTGLGKERGEPPRTIAERARSLGGTAKISALPRGTALTVALPWGHFE